MKIGISGYVGNKLTGIGRVLINILKESSMQSPHDEFILFANHDFIWYNEIKELPNIKVIPIKVSKDDPIKNIIWHQYKFQKALKLYNCDIALIPNFSLLLWKRIPTVVIIHDMIEFNIPNKFDKLRMIYRKIAVPRMAKFSDKIITVSNSSKRDIIKYCNVKEEKIVVAPNGVDHSVFRKYSFEEEIAVLRNYGLKPNEFILYVGTIDYPGKNIKILLEAFFNLKRKKKIEKKLVIIGKDGFNSNIIYDFVNSSKYKDDVIFTGYINEDDLPFFFSGAMVFLYLSLYEGFGLPVLEAMSCGTPAICPNTSSFPEIIGDLELAVNPTKITDVERKLYSILLDDVFRNNLIRKCLDRSMFFQWSKAAQSYINVFNDLVN